MKVESLMVFLSLNRIGCNRLVSTKNLRKKREAQGEHIIENKNHKESPLITTLASNKKDK